MITFVVANDLFNNYCPIYYLVVTPLAVSVEINGWIEDVTGEILSGKWNNSYNIEKAQYHASPKATITTVLFVLAGFPPSFLSLRLEVAFVGRIFFRIWWDVTHQILLGGFWRRSPLVAPFRWAWNLSALVPGWAFPCQPDCGVRALAATWCRPVQRGSCHFCLNSSRRTHSHIVDVCSPAFLFPCLEKSVTKTLLYYIFIVEKVRSSDHTAPKWLEDLVSSPTLRRMRSIPLTPL